MIRGAMKDFIAKEIVPIRDELEHGDTPPYEVLRKLYSTFGIDEWLIENSFPHPCEEPTDAPRSRPRHPQIRSAQWPARQRHSPEPEPVPSCDPCQPR